MAILLQMRTVHSITISVMAILFCFTAASARISEGPGDSTRNRVIILNTKKIQLKEVATLPKALKEASGLEITQGRYFWSHNDDGVPALFCFDSTGNLTRTVHLNHLNRGWEDLTEDDEGNVYIGGFGNNKNDKRDLHIYKVPHPEKNDGQVVNAEMIHYTYEDQKTYPPSNAGRNFDVDAMVAIDDALYLFTKNRTKPFTGYSKIYRLSQQPGKQTATLVDSIYVGKGPMMNHWITSVDLSPDKKTLALLFHDHLWLLRDFQNENFSKGNIYEINLEHYSHKAGVSFMSDEKIYIVDEFEFDLIGGKLYSLDLKPLRGEIK